jgi:hypothetical protein
MTVLESVILQTGVYAPSRKGRLSVYWGDQIFIPSSPPTYTPSYHVDIMCTLGSMVGEEEWKDKGLEKYGVIAVSENGEGAQVEKVDHATAVRMLAQLGTVTKVGPSLGSFSVSAPFLDAIMLEFASELATKQGKMDTDPHFWMPMTLGKDDYVGLMAQKKVAEDVSRDHHDRMAKFRDAFMAASSSSPSSSSFGLFGAVDVGSDACWWDYGQLKKYASNNMKLIENDDDAALLRQFLGVESRVDTESATNASQVCDASCVFATTVNSGSITASVVSSVSADVVEIDGALLINVKAKKIVAARGSIIYNVVDTSDEGIVAAEGEVICGLFAEDGSSKLVRSNLNIDGGVNWKEVVCGNDKSFEGYHGDNLNADVTKIEQAKKKAMK